MFNPYLLRLDPINLLNINLLYPETFAERVARSGELSFHVCDNGRDKLKEGRAEVMLRILEGR
jgi:hypothetical protein